MGDVMYKLNDEKITEKEVNEFIDDLAMFPMNSEDVSLDMDERKRKYKDELSTNGTLKISETLVIEKVR